MAARPAAGPAKTRLSKVPGGELVSTVRGLRLWLWLALIYRRGCGQKRGGE